MGREIRRVPPNWEHPKSSYNERYYPLYDKNFEISALEWVENFDLWRKGKHPKQLESRDYKNVKYFWEYEYPPDSDSCRHYKNEEATWFQVYETVTEGTPVTPPFETQKELIDYLVKHGEFCEKETGQNRASRKAIENFVLHVGKIPSAIFQNGKLTSGIELCENLITTEK